MIGIDIMASPSLLCMPKRTPTLSKEAYLFFSLSIESICILPYMYLYLYLSPFK
uniref:Uncharacterized protein n=1 Tax=Picea glauca TaxID=3330 RepID=A0A117NIZ0_PICGL|nr:hypothetical protein ABT39_MTgene550 [Picea glauca]QHR89395.1 hypothetical protein Q903MT_gene3416 [Picea sitchensis]